MTTQAAEGGTPPAATNTPATATPATPAAATPVPQPADESQPWFKERLDRAKQLEREAVLTELGVKDTAKAKADLVAAEKAREEAKSVADKLTDTASKLTKTESELEAERAINKEWATRMMLALTAEQQAAVKAIAGENHAKQLAAINALTPTWAAQTPAAPAAPAKPATPAAGTAPPPNAPASTTISQPNHQEVHAGLLKTNPFAAASYALEHMADVFPEQRT